MSNTSSQQGLSNKPCCDLGGVLVVPLRAILRVFTLSSSFRLRLVQYSTSEAINHIFEISSTFRFDWIPFRVSRRACCLGTPHVLLLSHFDLLPCPLASCAPFGTLSTPYESP